MQKSKAEMLKEIEQLNELIGHPGVPADEKKIYRATIEKIRAKIESSALGTTATGREASAPIQSQPTPRPSLPSPANTAHQAEAQINASSTHRTISATPRQPSPTMRIGAEPTATQPMSATIAAANQSSNFNPSVTITWADGYSITVTEGQALSHFKSRFRDCVALKHAETSPSKIWMHDTAWRAKGLLECIERFRGQPQTLKSLGFRYRTPLQMRVFDEISKT